MSTLILGEAQRTVSSLAREISRPDGNAKSRRAYDYFFGGADWSSTGLAKCHAEYVFEQLQVGAGDDVLLHIDDIKEIAAPITPERSPPVEKDLLPKYNGSSIFYNRHNVVKPKKG